MDDPFQLELACYRTIIFILVCFENDYFAVFLIKYLIIIFTSVLLAYQYLKYLPYYDDFISILFGYLIFLQVWILANSLLTFAGSLTGNFMIVLVGLVPAYLTVKRIRTRILEIILLKPPDKTSTELEAIIQSHAVYSLITSKITTEQEIRLIGLVNLHQNNCQNQDCPLHRAQELFDPCLDKFIDEESLEKLHKNQIFLKHFTKMYFEEGIINFCNMPGIRLAYASFLFHAFNNVHAALTELAFAKKNKPNIMQSFEIYKFEQMVESYMIVESQKHKGISYNLSQVIEFEQNLKDCSLAIWQASNVQLNFWNHLQQNIVDFNLLDQDNKNLNKLTKKINSLWEKLCETNENYKPAISKYASYLRDIRNNDQLALEIEKNKNSNEFIKKSINNYGKSNEILFDEKTAVIHISGNKEGYGKILKVNQGILAVFGYNPNELIQNPISKIMPSLIGRKHNDLMEEYFKSGRNRIFNKERYLFGLHKNGFCFQAKLLVKPMPRLENGFMQYVGMIRQMESAYEYIITDLHGQIDCISQGLGKAFKIKGKSLHKCGKFNVQMLAPDLEYCYQAELKKSGKGQKFKEAGGEEVMFYIPKKINKIITEVRKYSGKDFSSKLTDQMSKIIKANCDLNRKNTIQTEHESKISLLKMEEYKDPLVKAKLKCEVQDLSFGIRKSKIKLMNIFRRRNV